MKNLRALVLLFLANAISGVAQGMSMIAIPWYFTKNEDTSLFGIIYAVITFISFFWGPLGGTFVDKYNRKHIFLALTTISGSVLLLIAAYGFYLGYLPWPLVALAFLTTFMNYNVHYPNLYAFVQEISEVKYYGRITSIIEIQGQLASMLAGAGAAILLEGTKGNVLDLMGFDINLGFQIKPWTIYEIFLLDGITYIFGFIIIILIKYKPLVKRKIETGSVMSRLNIGIQYLKKNPYITLFGIASYCIFATILVFAFYLSAKYVDVQLQEDGSVFANSEIYYALGAILAGVAIRKIFKKLSAVISISILTLSTAILYFTLSFSNSIIIFYLMSLVLGITNAGTRIIRTTFLFNHIPNQVYGRASSIFFLSNVTMRIYSYTLRQVN